VRAVTAESARVPLGPPHRDPAAASKSQGAGRASLRSTEELRALAEAGARELGDDAPALDVVQWAAQNFPGTLAVACSMADAVLLVVDAQVGITETDARVVRMLRRSGKPVVLAANKVDSPAQEGDAAALWNLGLGEPFPVSALHGRGSGEVLDAVMEVLPEVSAVATAAPEGDLHRVALVGRPNVGKSSLLNSIAGRERVVVNETAGTTRDPVDEIIELDGRQWVFVDTAGIRRRVKQSRGADYYAVLRTQGAIDKAEVAVVLLDASEPISEQDVRVMQQVIDAGRALVLVCNKWDLVSGDRRAELDREMERELVQIRWAERVNLSAKTGWHANRLTRAMQTALDSWDRRIPTGRLNSFLGELAAAHPHPVRGGRQPRILFATQPSVRPPRLHRPLFSVVSLWFLVVVFVVFRISLVILIIKS